MNKNRGMLAKLMAVTSALALMLGTVPAYAQSFTSDGSTTIPISAKVEGW